MLSLFGIGRSSGKKDKLIQKLRKENKSLNQEVDKLKAAISPLTDLGFKVTDMKNMLKPMASFLAKEIEKEKTKHAEAAFHSKGTSASSSIGIRR
ncbi:MAG: hypothetical protein K8R53_04140 [Bacteroidales bacterium]|nr:hypothetical protein [Bacteroidales bacterium]